MKEGKALLLMVGLLSVATIAKEDKEKEDIGTVIGIDLGTTYSWWVRDDIATVENDDS